MYNILVNWDEQLAFFTVAKQLKSLKVNTKYEVPFSKEMLFGKSKLLVLFYLQCQLYKSVRKLLLFFQQASTDPHCLLSQLM